MQTIEHKGETILFTDSLVGGGAQRQLVTLAIAMHNRGRKVRVLTYSNQEQLAYLLKEKSIPWDVVKKSCKLDILFFVKLIKYFRDKCPSAVISYLNTANLWVRIAGPIAGVKNIITSERNIDINRSKLRVQIEKLLHPLSRKIVVNASAIKELLEGLGIPEKKVSIIYNGIDVSYFCPASPEKARSFREQYGIMDHEFLILLPGRMSIQKNHMALLNAFIDIHKTYTNIKVILVGNEFDKKIKSTLKEVVMSNNIENRFIFAGSKLDMPTVYTAADLVVLPSLWEGLPNVVLEAMACERPVLASDVSDNPIIFDNEKYGFVFSIKTEGGLREGIKKCLEQGKPDLNLVGKKARRRVADLCGIEIFADKYENLIDSK